MVHYTFKKLIEERVSLYGNDTYMITAATGEKVTFSMLEKMVTRTSALLKEEGVKCGDRVLLLLQNGIDFIVSYFAVTYCGAVVVPVNKNLKEKEIGYLIQDSEAVLAIVEKEHINCIPSEYAKEMKEMPGGLQYVWFAGSETKEVINQKEASRITADDIAMILYTSGTTGNAKGVLLSYRNLLEEASHIQTGHQLTREDTVLCVLPWFHINGLVITMLTPLFVGSKIVVAERFSVSRFWEYVEKYQIAWFSGVPTMYSHLLSKGNDKGWDISSMRFARSASSPLPVAVLHAFQERFGIPIIESYGITEGCSQITTNPMPPAVRKAGSVGLPFGNEIKIVDSYGRKVPSMTEGEVMIKGSNITRGYFKKREETKKAFTGAWFHSGDLGYIDEDGYLFLTGRIKELINRAGEKFSPREVDEVLYQIPSVELAAAVGIPDEIYGEEVGAFIKVRDGEWLTAEQVTDFCTERMADFKVPKRIYFVDAIPVGGNGKIQRLKLLDMYKDRI